MIRRLGIVVGAVFAVVLLGAVLALVILPRLLGWVPLTILSGSMEPTIPVGSQAIVEPIESHEDVAGLEVGDVISFMPYPDDSTLVTHRVITHSVDTDGIATVTTQGDANTASDGLELTAVQIRGVVRYHVPYAGYVAQLLEDEQKQAGVAVLAGGLIVYAMSQIIVAARESRRRGQSVLASGSESTAAAGSGHERR